MWILAAIAIIILIVFLACKKDDSNSSDSHIYSKLTRIYHRSNLSVEEKGKQAEESVSFALKKFGFVFDDYMIVDRNGKSHQIDHILICNKGIFVVETKNYSGRIYGNENSQEWTQYFDNDNSGNKFYNPVKQNKTHIYHINQMLGGKYKIHSCVVFYQCNIQNIKSDCVFTIQTLREYIFKSDITLTSGEIEKIKTILERRRNFEITSSEHVKNIHTTLENINNNICPRCGKQLVLRKGKYGEFYGCTGYPSCKFKKNINNGDNNKTISR